MIISNEPGYYKKENLVYVSKISFMPKRKKWNEFENLTYAPIDKNLIIKNLLNKREIFWLNQYHNNVYKKLKKYMSKKEVVLLKKSCSKI